MGHDYFGDVSFAEEKFQMYTKQFDLTSSFSVGDNNIYQYFTSYQGSKLVNRTLSQEEKIPQVSFDLVFEKEFELSHSLVRGSVYFIGYKTPDLDE
ncbi:hypothetical protein Bca4012_078098 [Brassica carinata]